MWLGYRTLLNGTMRSDEFGANDRRSHGQRPTKGGDIDSKGLDSDAFSELAL